MSASPPSPFSRLRSGSRCAGLTLAVWCFALMAGLLRPGIAEEAPETTLQLSYGDVLEGELMPGDGTGVRFRSAMFEEPVTFGLEAVQRITFSGNGEEEAAEDFRVLLRNGDVIHGDLVALDESVAKLRCARHGEVEVLRTEIRSVTRMNNPSLLFLGPRGLDGWSTLPGNQRGFWWQVVPGGGLFTDRWRSELFREMSWPDRVEIEFALQSSRRLEFTMALESRLDDTLRLETWDDALVLVHGTDFTWLANLSDEDVMLEFRVFWDRVGEKILVFDGRGRRLGSADFRNDVAQSLTGGVYLRNKGMDLTVNRMRIARWNGEVPAFSLEQRPSLRLSDGSMRDAPIAELLDGGRTLRLVSGETVPMESVDTLFFGGRDRPEGGQGGPGGVEVAYADGSKVSGSFLGASDGSLRLETAYSRAPLRAALAGAERVDFMGAESREPDLGLDQLLVGDEVWHGRIAASRKPGRAVAWQPMGASEAVDLAGQLDQVTLRRGTARAVSNLDGDRLFLTSGEILSCRILEVSQDRIALRTELAEVREVPAALVRAMEFREGRLQLTGFGDRAWREESEGEARATREPGRIVLDGGFVTHPTMLRGDEIHFRVDWDERAQGAVTLGLFGNHLPQGKYPLEISFSCWGNRLWVAASETGSGQMMDGDDIMIQDGRAKVRLILGEEEITVEVNGRSLIEFWYGTEKRTGNGLAFRSGGPWFNNGTRLSEAIIDQFEVRSTSGLLNAMRVDEAAKEQVLTVPRFRRNRPDTHVVVAGNGDLLRGRLDEVSASAVTLSSRLREIVVARDRVSGIIAMAEEEETEQGIALPPGEIYVYVNDGSALRIQPAAMTTEGLAGISPALGTCRIPLDDIRQIEMGTLQAISGKRLYADWVRRPAPEPEIPDPAGPPSSGSEMIGQEAPDLEFPLLSGETFQLSEFRGKVVVLEFWASWCGPCRFSLDETAEALAKLNPEEVAWFAVNQGEPAAVIRPYLKLHSWEFPAALDLKEASRAKFQFDSLPHTVVIDRDGKVAWVRSEYRPGHGEVVGRVVEELMAK